MKVCNKCKQEKNESEFYKGERYKDGLRPICKKCFSIRSSRHYKENPNVAKRLKEKAVEWYKNNLDKHRNIARISHKKYREKRKEYYKSYREEHKEYYRSYNKEYYYNNKEYYQQKKKEWYKNNKDKVKETNEQRRARKNGLNGNVFETEWKELCSHYGNVCLRCGSSDKLTQDHVVPLSKGGFHTIYNLQPLCRSCNSSKRDKTIDYRPDVISLVTKLNC